jgi:hypothetical protein
MATVASNRTLRETLLYPGREHSKARRNVHRLIVIAKPAAPGEGAEVSVVNIRIGVARAQIFREVVE